MDFFLLNACGILLAKHMVGYCWRGIEVHSLPNIVLVIKSRKMRWVGHEARMGEGRDVYKVLVGKTEEKKTAGDTQA
jgi:hypothetical protein